MKMLPPFLCLAAAFLLVTGSSLHAQYNPPPPPDQDQGVPPPDQGSMAPDDSVPPPDGQQAPPADDQGVPPPDDGAASDDSGGDVNFQTFYNDLSSQGTWVQTDNYGYAWQPNVQDPDWAPYQNGHWVYTDEGWAWVADDSEPWGWATYHYGRWVNIEGEGWVWVPGYTWAPAWVSWRYGGGYCGWAPLPPDTFVGIDFGSDRDGLGLVFHIGGDCDTAYGIGPGYYNFLPVAYLGSRDYHRHYINRYNNYAIINNTRNVTNINVNGRAASGRIGRVTSGGPSFTTVNAQSRTPVPRAELTRSARVGTGSLSGGRLAVYAPRVSAAGTGATFRPRSVGRTLNNVQVNRGTSISQPLAANARVRPAGATAQQIAAARTAEAHVTPGAAIATASSHPTQELSRPLTSYQPHGARTRTSTNGAVAPRTTTSERTQAPAANAADRAFTGEATGNRTSEKEAAREARAAAPNGVHPQVVPSTAGGPASHPQVDREQTERPDVDAARLQREQAERAQADRAPTEHAPVQNTEREAEHSPAQNAPAPHPQFEHQGIPQHAVQQAPPPQHAAPAPQQQRAPAPQGAPPSGGGFQPGQSPSGGPNGNNNNNHH